jgi:hypothetical protein
MRNAIEFSGGMVLALVLLAKGGDACAEGQPKIGVYVAFDESYAKSLEDVFAAGPEAPAVTFYDSLGKAAVADDELLVLAMPRGPELDDDDVLAALKRKKVIGIGYGAAQIFGQLELQINGGACAHFGQVVPELLLQENQLLGEAPPGASVVAYMEQMEGDNFGMFIPQHAEVTQFVDVIARMDRDENYAPIVAEGDFVMIGLSAPPASWSDAYRDLVRKTIQNLLHREKQPFPKAQFEVLPPGAHGFDLAEGRSTKDPFSTTFYFKFTRPTRFVAKLDHFGSGHMMVSFRGEKDGLHWTREDAKTGEPLTIACEITADDLQAIGDKYWVLTVTNFDAINRASCVLHVEYDREQQQTEKQPD